MLSNISKAYAAEAGNDMTILPVWLVGQNQ